MRESIKAWPRPLGKSAKALMVSWALFMPNAMKDAKLAASDLKPKAQELLAVLENDPFQNPAL